MANRVAVANRVAAESDDAACDREGLNVVLINVFHF